MGFLFLLDGRMKLIARLLKNIKKSQCSNKNTQKKENIII